MRLVTALLLATSLWAENAKERIFREGLLAANATLTQTSIDQQNRLALLTQKVAELNTINDALKKQAAEAPYLRAQNAALTAKLDKRPATVIIPEEAQSSIEHAGDQLKVGTELTAVNQVLLQKVIAALRVGFEQQNRKQLIGLGIMSCGFVALGWLLSRKQGRDADKRNEELRTHLEKAIAGQAASEGTLKAILDKKLAEGPHADAR